MCTLREKEADARRNKTDLIIVFALRKQDSPQFGYSVDGHDWQGLAVVAVGGTAVFNCSSSA